MREAEDWMRKLDGLPDAVRLLVMDAWDVHVGVGGVPCGESADDYRARWEQRHAAGLAVLRALVGDAAGLGWESSPFDPNDFDLDDKPSAVRLRLDRPDLGLPPVEVRATCGTADEGRVCYLPGWSPFVVTFPDDQGEYQTVGEALLAAAGGCND